MNEVATERRCVPPEFMTLDDWNIVVAALELSPQQARIISLILQGKQDKQIAVELRLNRYTIRTYLRRVFDRSGIEDRMGLVLRIFALCTDQRRVRGCPPQG